jgi:amino acid permease
MYILHLQMETDADSHSYLDPSWGFAMGWNYTLGAGITVCAEVSAAILLIEYWNDSVSRDFSLCIHIYASISIFPLPLY